MKKVYMIARHHEVPLDPKNSSGGNTKNESFLLSDRLKRKDLAEASIIIELAEQAIVKNRFTERTFDDLYKYFVTHYSNYINTWFENAEKK